MKFVKYLLTATSLVCALALSVACETPGDGASNDNGEHTHAYGEWAVTEATCTEAGEKTRTCACGEKETVAIEALGHDEKSFEGKASTCTEVGYDDYVACSRCDYTTKTELPKKEHTEVEHAGKTPTCTEKGYEPYVTCAKCDYTTFAELPMTAHTEISHDAKEPTCAEVGNIAYVTCANCEYTTYEEIPMIAHTEVPHEAKEPTCTEVGNIAYVTCANCDYTTYEEIPAKRHNFVDSKCTVCGASACVEHFYEDWVTEREPTCTVAGVKYKECMVCLERETEEIPVVDHKIVTHEAKEPTCVTPGHEAYENCETCDYTTYVEIPANGVHKEVSHDAKAPTCCEVGHNAYVSCENCDYTTYEPIPVVAHKYENKVCIWCGKKDYTLPVQPLSSDEEE